LRLTKKGGTTWWQKKKQRRARGTKKLKGMKCDKEKKAEGRGANGGEGQHLRIRLEKKDRNSASNNSREQGTHSKTRPTRFT